MSIFTTAYDTTVGSVLNTKKLSHAIEEAMIRDMIYTVNLDVIKSMDYKPVFITGRNVSESNIPLFAHPFTMEIGNNQKYLCADIRSCVRADPNQAGNSGIDIKVKTELSFIKARMVMQLLWLQKHESQIKNGLQFAGQVFAAWVSDSIAKRYALDPKEQLELYIISHFYYQNLFSNDDVIDDDKRQMYATHTIKASRASADMVFSVFDKIETMSNLNSLCENSRTVIENVRLKDLNPGMIITILGNSWFGLNAREILAVALEHPPTWVCLVYIVLCERTYKNSMLAKVAERYGKNQITAEYLNNFNGLMDSCLIKE